MPCALIWAKLFRQKGDIFCLKFYDKIMTMWVESHTQFYFYR